MFFHGMDWFSVCAWSHGFSEGPQNGGFLERRARVRESRGLVGIQQGLLTPYLHLNLLYPEQLQIFSFIGIPSKLSQGRGG